MPQVQVTKTNGKYLIEVPAEARTDDEFFQALKFELLAQKWKEESRFYSMTKQLADFDSYRSIIEMGAAALPLILKDLQREPSHWFFALRAITQENPVKKGHEGKIELMANDWIEWGRMRKLI